MTATQPRPEVLSAWKVAFEKISDYGQCRLASLGAVPPEDQGLLTKRGETAAITHGMLGKIMGSKKAPWSQRRFVIKDGLAYYFEVYLEDEAQCKGVCCVEGSVCARVQSDGRAFCIELSTPLPRNPDKSEGDKGVFILDCQSENNRELWLATLVKHGAHAPCPPPSPMGSPVSEAFVPGPQEKTGLPYGTQFAGTSEERATQDHLDAQRKLYRGQIVFSSEKIPPGVPPAVLKTSHVLGDQIWWRAVLPTPLCNFPHNSQPEYPPKDLEKNNRATVFLCVYVNDELVDTDRWIDHGDAKNVAGPNDVVAANGCLEMKMHVVWQKIFTRTEGGNHGRRKDRDVEQMGGGLYNTTPSIQACFMTGADGVTIAPEDGERTIAPEDEAAARMVEMTLIKAGEGEHEVRFELCYKLVLGQTGQELATPLSLPVAVGSFKMHVPPGAVTTGLPRRPKNLAARMAGMTGFDAEVVTIEEEMMKTLKQMCSGGGGAPGKFEKVLPFFVQAKGTSDGQVWHQMEVVLDHLVDANGKHPVKTVWCVNCVGLFYRCPSMGWKSHEQGLVTCDFRLSGCDNGTQKAFPLEYVSMLHPWDGMYWPLSAMPLHLLTPEDYVSCKFDPSAW
jgi:hypothetical protein